MNHIIYQTAYCKFHKTFLANWLKAPFVRAVSQQQIQQSANILAVNPENKKGNHYRSSYYHHLALHEKSITGKKRVLLQMVRKQQQ
jgi:hypothetical protein